MISKKFNRGQKNDNVENFLKVLGKQRDSPTTFGTPKRGDTAYI